MAIDPPSKKSLLKSPRFQADIVFVSKDEDDYNGLDAISAKDGSEPFFVKGPGEYEVKDIISQGVSSGNLNTVYRISLENLNLCHLGGGFLEKELKPDLLEIMDGIDILFIPIGGGKVIDFDAAASLIGQIEPKIIIPMHYPSKDLRPDKKKLADFLKEMGAEGTASVDKLTLKKKEIGEKNAEVICLEPIIN